MYGGLLNPKTDFIFKKYLEVKIIKKYKFQYLNKGV